MFPWQKPIGELEAPPLAVPMAMSPQLPRKKCTHPRGPGPWCGRRTWARRDPGPRPCLLLPAGGAIPIKRSPPSPSSSGHQNRRFSSEDLEDPLAGLLSYDEGEITKKPPVTESKIASDKSPGTVRDQGPCIPLTPGDTPIRKKEELFDDGDDIMATLGFGDSPKAEKRQMEDQEGPRPARSTLDELLGRGMATKLLTRPGTGERREFKLDKKYQRPQDSEDAWGDEDVTFGAYQPTMGSSEGRQSRRQSVRSQCARPSALRGLKEVGGSLVPPAQTELWRRSQWETHPSRCSGLPVPHPASEGKEQEHISQQVARPLASAGSSHTPLHRSSAVKPAVTILTARFLADSGPDPKGESGFRQSPPATSSPIQPRKGGADWLGLKDDDLDLLPASPTREARRESSALAMPSVPPPESQHSAPAGLPPSKAKPSTEGAGSPAKASQDSKLQASEKEEEDWLSHALSRKKSKGLAREQGAGASEGLSFAGMVGHSPSDRGDTVAQRHLLEKPQKGKPWDRTEGTFDFHLRLRGKLRPKQKRACLFTDP
ncbi:Fas-binding factor 1 [Saguinus oedipus]|uniref:Fas-binding factor 1 n=1 Tax=Saguinus oedipus TaxID=9490 RepID=A0ABQ9VRS3_SAGOE|nr:Fas-binding factor 1 [Saguinus oedipus]